MSWQTEPSTRLGAFNLRWGFSAALTWSLSLSPRQLFPSSLMRVLQLEHVPFSQNSLPQRNLGTHHGHCRRLQELGRCHHSEVGNVHEDVAPCHQRDPNDDGQGQVSRRGKNVVGGWGAQGQTRPSLEELTRLLFLSTLFFPPLWPALPLPALCGGLEAQLPSWRPTQAGGL